MLTLSFLQYIPFTSNIMTYIVYITIFHPSVPVTTVHFLPLPFLLISSFSFPTHILRYKKFPTAQFCYLSTINFLCVIFSFVFGDLFVQKSLLVSGTHRFLILYYPWSLPVFA